MGFKYHQSINMDNKTFNLPNDLNAIQDIVNDCHLCTLGKTSKERIFFIGNKDSKIIFITTIPINDDEDTVILNNMLKNVLNISIEDICLLNIIKCKTLKDISSLSSSVDICKNYIKKQIELLNPRLIVTLGDSYNYLLDDNTDISILSGSVLKYKEIDLVPIYHPTLLNKNPSLKKRAFWDLKKIKSLMELF
jgi:DNA polymerase